MTIKKNDFIELEYIARLKNTNQIFDLTDEKLAKENNVYNKNSKYGPVIICVGQHDILPGLDDFLIDKKIGNYNVDLNPEHAFGKRDPKLIKIIPTNIFKKKEITPFPGLQVNIDNSMGIIRSVSGGRTIVDFNHPLAGKPVVYEIKILRILDNDEEKLKSFCKLHFNTDAELKDGNAFIKLKMPEQLGKLIEERIKAIIPSIKEIKFEPLDEKKDEKKDDNKHKK